MAWFPTNGFCLIGMSGWGISCEFVSVPVLESRLQIFATVKPRTAQVSEPQQTVCLNANDFSSLCIFAWGDACEFVSFGEICNLQALPPSFAFYVTSARPTRRFDDMVLLLHIAHCKLVATPYLWKRTYIVASQTRALLRCYDKSQDKLEQVFLLWE